MADGFQAMLKDIVDETSLGKYDFMYLRIGTYCHVPLGCRRSLTRDTVQILPTTASKSVGARVGHDGRA